MNRNSFIQLAIFSLFLATRLINLDILPIFADEAIYIRWAQQIKYDSSLAFLPLYDGKTPFFMWVLVPMLSINYFDPLIISRLVSVLTGIINWWVVGEITKFLGGGKKIQIFARLIYTITPMAMMLDRMALIDSMLTATMGLTLLTLIITIRKNSYIWGLCAGLLWGVAILTKLPAIFLLPIMLLMPPWLHFSGLYRFKRDTYTKLALVTVVGFGLFSITRLSLWFSFLFSRGNDFRFSVTEILNGAWKVIIENQFVYLDWIIRYFGLALILIPFLMWYLMGKKALEASYKVMGLFLLSLIWIAPITLMGKVVYSRYLMPMLIFLIPATALAIEQLFNHKFYRILGSTLTFGLVQGFIFLIPMLIAPDKVLYHKKDQEQYLNTWSAGFGVKEVVNYLRNNAKSENAIVATEGFFGTLPDGLFVYLDHTNVLENTEIYGVGVPVNGVPNTLKDKVKTGKVGYVLANENRLTFDYKALCEETLSIPKPLNGSPLKLLKCIK